MDLFYLDEDIVEKTSYKYITNLIDHLSKWICSYTLKTKTGRDFLLCLVNYTYAFWIRNKLHNDNGILLKNIHFNMFCADNNIKHNFSKSYNPKSADFIEASHKEIKQFVKELFYTRESDPFDQNEIWLLAINNHNNNIHSTTNYKPIELRDINDEKIIQLVQSNIYKNK